MSEESKWPVREKLPELPQKTFKVVPSEVHATLYKIVYQEGGAVPKELRSSYNKRKLAQIAIEHHLKHRVLKRNYASIKKRKENGKIKDKTGI